MVRKEINTNNPLTEEQKIMLLALENFSDEPDEDCPELTQTQLSQFQRISECDREEHHKISVTLQLSPQALEKAKSFGKGYTSVLSHILENALNNSDTIHQNL